MKIGNQPWAAFVTMAMLLGGLLPGCVITGPEQDQGASFVEAEELIGKGLYRDAAKSLSDFVYAHGDGHPQTAKAYELRAGCHMAMRKYGLARTDYNNAVRAAEVEGVYFPGKQDLVHQCRLKGCDTYLLSGAYRSADLAYRKLLWKKPPMPVRDEILYRRYICAVKMKKADPDQFLRQINDMSRLDEQALASRFLDKDPVVPVYKPTPHKPVKPEWKKNFVSGQWVVIDAGHGGKDPGATSVLGYYEKTLNLAVALRLAEKLRTMGLRVEMTRSTDKFIELNDRADKGNQLYAGLFVSLHADSAANSSAHGYTIYIRRSASAAERTAARIVDKALETTGLDSRGIRPAGFRVLTRSNGPALLVEMGFLSNPLEADLMRKGKFIESMAHCLSNGIRNYLRTRTVDT